MGNKRIYFGREVSKYAEIAGGTILTITALFFVLMTVGFEITGSDDYCLGTPEDPCVSYGKICNLGPDNYDIYNPDQIKIDFSPTIKDSWMFFKDGRVKKEMLYDLGIDASTKGWRYENFTNETKPRKDRIYVHRFARYTCQDYMLVGLKENPDDIIKWGMGVKGEYLDPFWYGGEEETTILVELESQLNISANISGVANVCVDIDHPDYGINYTCGSPTANFLFNISYFRKTELNDSSTEINFSFNGPENQTIYVYAHQYDEVNNLSINLTGFTYNGTYPSIKIYVNNTLSNTIGLLFTGELTQEEMNDGNLSQDLFFDPAGEIHTVYIEIPKNAEVSSAFVNFSSYSQEMNSTGINIDFGSNWNYDSLTELNGYFWAGDALNDRIEKFDIDGVYAGITLNIAGQYQEGGVLGFNDTLWLLSYNNDEVREYYVNGSRGITFSLTAAHVDPAGIAECNDYFYIGDRVDDLIYKYNLDGTYTGTSYDVSGELDYISGIECTDGFLYAIDWEIGLGHTRFIYKYWENGTYTGTSFNLTEINPSQSGLANGIMEYNEYFWVTSFASANAYKYKAITYPEDPFMETGSFDGTREWSYSGVFNTTNRTNNFNDSINDFLDICTADSDGYCTVPFYMRSDAIGVLNISNIEINYSYNPNPVYLDVDIINSFLGDSIGFADIPITISDSQNGTVTISDIRYDYAGGNDTIEVLVYELGDKTNNETLNLINYYSDWDYAFPIHIDWLEFIPQLPTAKNVTPYAQTPSKPILNITNYGYGGLNSTFSVYLNESFACVNLSMSTTNDKSNSFILNDTWTTLITNFTYQESDSLWMWADYDCSYTTWKLWEPALSFRNCAEGAVCSEDLT